MIDVLKYQYKNENIKQQITIQPFIINTLKIIPYLHTQYID